MTYLGAPGEDAVRLFRTLDGVLELSTAAKTVSQGHPNILCDWRTSLPQANGLHPRVRGNGMVSLFLVILGTLTPRFAVTEPCLSIHVTLARRHQLETFSVRLIRGILVAAELIRTSKHEAQVYCGVSPDQHTFGTV